MAINFKLVPAFEVDPVEDDMGRRWAGWSNTHSAEANFENNRGLWRLGARAERERYATFSLDGRICLVASIDAIETIPAKDPHRRPKRALIGRVLPAGHPAHEGLIDQVVDSHRNPVSYLDDPTSSPSICACGCGGPIPGHRIFVPGHDQRAVHDRITRQWGNTLAFITWFDATYPEATT